MRLGRSIRLARVRLAAWERRWGDAYVQVPVANQQALWARSLFYMLATYGPDVASPAPPMVVGPAFPGTTIFRRIVVHPSGAAPPRTPRHRQGVDRVFSQHDRAIAEVHPPRFQRRRCDVAMEHADRGLMRM